MFLNSAFFTTFVSAIFYNYMCKEIKRSAVALSLIAIMAIFLAPGAAAQYSHGDKSFGIRAGYESRNTSMVTGVAFEYTFSRHVRLAPEFDIVFRHNDRDAGGISCNVQFPFQFHNDRAAYYPLAGIMYRSWGIHNKDYDSTKDVTTRHNTFGLNFGGGVEYMVSSTCKLSLEAVYALQRHYPGAEIKAGVSFVF